LAIHLFIADLRYLGTTWGHGFFSIC